MYARLLQWLNWALMVNLFLVIASFAWLTVAVLGETIHVPLGLQLWYKLWNPVFTPAIGILMAGAIVSGLTSWVTQKLEARATRDH
jgi:TRAP-type C4-dicarboxylate transport system permease small subunit